MIKKSLQGQGHLRSRQPVRSLKILHDHICIMLKPSIGAQADEVSPFFFFFFPELIRLIQES